MEEAKKVIYIAGPITGVKNYWEDFEQAEDDLTAAGYIPLSPSRLPEGMTNAQYMRVCLALIDSADAVLFLHGFDRSEGAQLELQYCKYTGKPCAEHRSRDKFTGETSPVGVRVEWLKYHLGEVLGV